MKTIGIVRNRGQLTIPDSIRRVATWISPLAPVSISVVKPDEIVIKPHQKQIDWEQILENIRKSRAISGKGHTNTAKFLEQDRNSH
jgi:bifunctional DNA-binding transcriptional regulator/antitoxin component of YhaV-PrlF toxin-antitoxin module